MTLAETRLKELDSPALSDKERVLLRCHLAADFIYAGQYEAAREALWAFWRGIGERPNLEGLDERTAAEVLLQVGSLSGWLGASGQTAGAQAKAKDLISESAALFESLGGAERAALARSDLALCYWREGAYDEARVLLVRASDELADAGAEQRVRVLLRRVTVEYTARRLNDALNILTEYAPLLDGIENHTLLGGFHSHLALVLRGLGVAEGHSDYLDRAIIEYTAAIFHYGEAKHERYRANNENNLAFLLYRLGRYADSHEHLDRARRTLMRLKDAGLLAQVEETRARVLIAEQKYREANRVIGTVIQALERGGASALLANAFTVQGVAWARLGAHQSSINIMRRAVSLAEEAGALSNAGIAALTLIEEHGAERLSQPELYSVNRRADESLKGTQDAEEVTRLRACARLTIKRLSGARLRDRNFTLHGALHDIEAKYIEQALREAGGSVTKAAKLLGVRYQTLTNLLNNRHKSLLKLRKPATKRGRSIFKKPQ